MEKISWADRVRNEEVLHRVKEETNILHTIKRRKVNWIGHILRRNWLLNHVMEKRGCWKLKQEALDRTLWRTRFGRGYGAVVWQTTGWMVLKIQVFWHARLCRIFHHKGFRSPSIPQPLMMEVRSSETSGIKISAAQRNNPEDLNPVFNLLNNFLMCRQSCCHLLFIPYNLFNHTV
jgi:hypothetical protein